MLDIEVLLEEGKVNQVHDMLLQEAARLARELEGEDFDVDRIEAQVDRSREYYPNPKFCKLPPTFCSRNCPIEECARIKALSEIEILRRIVSDYRRRIFEKVTSTPGKPSNPRTEIKRLELVDLIKKEGIISLTVRYPEGWKDVGKFKLSAISEALLPPLKEYLRNMGIGELQTALLRLSVGTYILRRGEVLLGMLAAPSVREGLLLLWAKKVAG